MKGSLGLEEVSSLFRPQASVLSPLLFLPDFPLPTHVHPHTPSSLPSCCHLLFQKLPHTVPPPLPWRGSCIRVHASGSQALCTCVPVCLARVEHASSACVRLCHMHVCSRADRQLVCVCVCVCVCVDCLQKCIVTHGLSPTLAVPLSGGGGPWRTCPSAACFPSFKP